MVNAQGYSTHLVDLQSDPVIHRPTFQQCKGSNKDLTTERRGFEIETTTDSSNLPKSVSLVYDKGYTYQGEKDNPRGQNNPCPNHTFPVSNRLGFFFECMEDLLLGLESGFTSSRG
jgi:hypothetical protein